MALSSLGIQGGAVANGTSTTMLIPNNLNASTTCIGICSVVYDNTGGGGADGFVSLTDTKGNTWTSRVNRLNDPGAASAGTVLRIFTCNWNVAPLTSSDILTFTNGANFVGVGFLIYVESSLGSATYVNGNTAIGSGTTQTITSTSITNGNFIIGVLGQEGNGTRSGATSNVNGTWTSPTGAYLSSNGFGTTTAGQESLIQYKQVTATATQIFNPTATPLGDWTLGWIQITETAVTTYGDHYGMMGFYGM